MPADPLAEARAQSAEWTDWLATMDGSGCDRSTMVAPVFRAAANHLRAALAEVDRLTAGQREASADTWITYDPETGYEQHNTEAAGYAALDALLDEHTDRAAESVHEQVESVALYRCERVAGIVQTVTATSVDDVEGDL